MALVGVARVTCETPESVALFAASMHFIADDAIFKVEKLVAPLLGEGETLSCIPGREIAQADLSECVALLTRTVTPVDAALLDAAPKLKVVASASAGFDHVDRELLEERGVHFAHAPGCNALAVAQWVVAAWDELCSRPRHAHRRQARVGVVGHGQVGRRVAEMFRILGHEVVACDPPLHEAGGLEEHQPLDALVESCDVLTFHTPLTEGGTHPTRALLSAARAEAFLERGGTLINTSRGEVLELPQRVPEPGAMIVDVWPGEPNCPWAWMHRWVDGERVWGTPHIAGYSEPAKLRGAQMAVQGVADALGRELRMPVVVLNAQPGKPTRMSELTRFLQDHQALLEAASSADPAKAFLALRRGYEHRAEFWNVTFREDGPLGPFRPLLNVM